MNFLSRSFCEKCLKDMNFFVIREKHVSGFCRQNCFVRVQKNYLRGKFLRILVFWALSRGFPLELSKPHFTCSVEHFRGTKILEQILKIIFFETLTDSFSAGAVNTSRCVSTRCFRSLFANKLFKG